MKKFASINDFKGKSILFSKQIIGGRMAECTNVCTDTYTTMTVQVGMETNHIQVNTDNDTNQKQD